MKPPRVFIKQGAFWISCYVSGEPNDWRRPVGDPAIKLDKKFVDALAADPDAFKDEDGNWIPDWWKTSKHAPDIKAAINSMITAREFHQSGVLRPVETHARISRQTTIPSLEDLIDELNHEGSAEGSLGKETIRRRKTSGATILRFDKRFSVSDQIDKNWIARFRKWMKDPERDYTDWTQYTILQDLKLFYKYALSKRYILFNPLVDISFTQPETLVEHTPLEDELAMFRHLYNNDIHRFVEFVTQRLTGYRFSDIVKLRRPQLDMKNKLIVNARNIKGKRPEIMPMSDALYYLLSNSMDLMGKDYLFPDTYAAAMKALKISAAAVPVKYATHQCKRNYVLDMEDEKPLQHIFDLLIHHKTKSIAGRHYTAQNVALMRKTLNSAHGTWLTFLKELLANPALWRKRMRSEIRLKNRD